MNPQQDKIQNNILNDEEIRSVDSLPAPIRDYIYYLLQTGKFPEARLEYDNFVNTTD